MQNPCFDVVTCPRLILELETVLRRRKIRACVSHRASDALLSALTVGALWFPDPVASSFRLRDRNDEFVAQLAFDADAELLVSGDRDVLALGRQDNFSCVAPRDGVAIIERWCE
jgi:predicted nucleic acid-binding protein